MIPRDSVKLQRGDPAEDVNIVQTFRWPEYQFYVIQLENNLNIGKINIVCFQPFMPSVALCTETLACSPQARIRYRRPFWSYNVIPPVRPKSMPVHALEQSSAHHAIHCYIKHGCSRPKATCGTKVTTFICHFNKKHMTFIITILECVDFGLFLLDKLPNEKFLL